MKRMSSYRYLVFVWLMLQACLVAGQGADEPMGPRSKIFPDIPGYYTLCCDFHMHTVFSDGNVWPSIRVQEAIRDGLDAISITDHLEYQPHQTDIPNTDRNRPYQLALESARGTDLMIIPGAEITRSMPPGHFNAIFIEDANALNQPDVMEVFKEAKQQGAFVFWNHPHWTAQQPDGVATLSDMHRELLDEGLFGGIEIVNESSYSDEALEIAEQNKLTLLGNSDIHGMIAREYDIDQGLHRPVTLVFAKERSPSSLRQALMEQHTAVWFNHTLIGDPSFLIPLIEQSLEVRRMPGSLVQNIVIVNHSDTDFILENQSDYRLHNHAGIITIKAHSSQTLQVKTLKEMDSFELSFTVLNAFTSPEIHPEISFLIGDSVADTNPSPTKAPAP